MNYIIHIREDLGYSYYFIGLTINEHYYQTDDDICEQLNLDIKYYINLCKQYNGVYFDTYNLSGIYFKNRKDIENFKKWLENNIENLLIIKKLEGK